MTVCRNSLVQTAGRREAPRCPGWGACRPLPRGARVRAAAMAVAGVVAAAPFGASGKAQAGRSPFSARPDARRRAAAAHCAGVQVRGGQSGVPSLPAVLRSGGSERRPAQVRAAPRVSRPSGRDGVQPVRPPKTATASAREKMPTLLLPTTLQWRIESGCAVARHAKPVVYSRCTATRKCLAPALRASSIAWTTTPCDAPSSAATTMFPSGPSRRFTLPLI